MLLSTLLFLEIYQRFF